MAKVDRRMILAMVDALIESSDEDLASKLLDPSPSGSGKLYLMNAAIIPAGEYGHYIYRPCGDEELRHAAASAESCIQFDGTADYIHSVTGYRPEVVKGRFATLDPGDSAVIVRLPYRVQDPTQKGTITPEECEHGVLTRLTGHDPDHPDYIKPVVFDPRAPGGHVNKYLISSAVIPKNGFGTYHFRPISVGELAQAVPHTVSMIGYPATAELISKATGHPVPVNRGECFLKPGDVAYVVRPRSPGVPGTHIDHFELGLLRRLS